MDLALRLRVLPLAARRSSPRSRRVEIHVLVEQPQRLVPPVMRAVTRHHHLGRSDKRAQRASVAR